MDTVFRRLEPPRLRCQRTESTRCADETGSTSAIQAGQAGRHITGRYRANRAIRKGGTQADHPRRRKDLVAVHKDDVGECGGGRSAAGTRSTIVSSQSQLACSDADQQVVTGAQIQALVPRTSTPRHRRTPHPARSTASEAEGLVLVRHRYVCHGFHLISPHLAPSHVLARLAGSSRRSRIYSTRMGRLSHAATRPGRRHSNHGGDACCSGRELPHQACQDDPRGFHQRSSPGQHGALGQGPPC